ncbi:invasion associated locus B family protein [Xinfangfangia pollutisoli]|uniref:invasion associated locus B family protein n=1 Tax=Xinfangfangia pollutisoli TaxID=2865960 RepID=UPI001CD5FA39|nr:invasion associated locus B family protein [Xinfangfangia pollutisoli]
MKTNPLPLLALIAALAAPLSLAAQETTETPAPADPAPATVEGDGKSADGLSMGIEVGSGKAQVGDTYIAATFEQWEQRCIKTETGADPCQLYQLLKDSEGNSVAEFSVFSLPEGSPGPAVAGANLIAPLETLLTEGLRLSIDNSKERAYPFTFCTRVGCVARMGFTAEEIGLLKKGAKATMAIVPFVAPDQQVKLDVSLKGFTAGFDAMTAANKAADAAEKAAPAAAPAP